MFSSLFVLFLAFVVLSAMHTSPEKSCAGSKRHKPSRLYDPQVARGATTYIQHNCPSHNLPIDASPGANARRWFWLHRMFNLWSGRRRDRFIRNVTTRLAYSSCFTGRGGAETLVWLFCLVINSWRSDPIPPKPALVACDFAPHCQETLKSIAPGWRPTHITRDIKVCVPPAVLQEWESLVPPKTDFIPAQQMANRKLYKQVQDYYDQVYPHLIQAPCITHGRSCQLFAPSFERDDDTRIDKNGWMIYGHPQSLTVHWAGVVCKPLSQFGSLEGDRSNHALAQMIWQCERRLLREDMIFVECVKDYDPAVTAESLKESHKCRWCHVAPTMAGDSYSRDRVAAIFYNAERLVMVEDDSEFVQDLGVESMVPWEDQWIDCKVVEDLESEELRHTRVTPTDFDLNGTWEDLLWPSQKTRMLDYDAKVRTLVAQALAQPGSTCMYDLDQNPVKRARYTIADCDGICGRHVRTPCLISHDKLWNTTKQRIFLLHEKLNLHGYATVHTWQSGL